MDLMHNQAIRIEDDDLGGIYRVILDEPSIGKTVLASLDPKPVEDRRSKGGRKALAQPKNPRKKARLPNVGALIWVDRDVLERLNEQKHLHIIEIEMRNVPESRNKKAKEKYHKRVQAMAPFLSIITLRNRLIADQGIADLIQMSMERSGFSKSTVYGLFSTLCRLGFSERSLQLNYDRCGAPSVPRPCDHGGRKKAGAKTVKERLALHEGIVLLPDQPGMSTEWETLILAADAQIPAPKPPMPQRITRILRSAFIKRYKDDGSGELVPEEPALGTYPNARQIKNVLNRNTSRLQRLIERTTPGHFARSHRGMHGKSWQGVPGPGHTWAIDSTIGDIYLRSSINRAWIIGRPIVYIIVDVWSTAIVGFYVCLAGPSWDTAKVALFSAASDPMLVGSLWSSTASLVPLNPAPTLPARLLCDRGEYLSHGASQTSIELLPNASYTAPYRPDHKGIVEVLHRITKDKQYRFVPGTIDARRKELEERSFKPDKAVLTVQEYVLMLYQIFRTYNWSACRESRLDSHMKAQDVFATPAGLWQWGHEVGIGTRRAIPQSELISTLLPSAPATIRRDGVFFGGRNYESEVMHEEEWTAYTRNFGSREIPSNYFPGSVSRIWTPHQGQSGLIELSLSDYSISTPELTWDEVVDSEMYYKRNNAEREHQRMKRKVAGDENITQIVEKAKALTAAAIEADSGPKPTMRESRAAEREAATPTHSVKSLPQSDNTQEPDEFEESYADMMSSLIGSMRTQEGQNV